jgi:hypothetical protein
VAEDVAIARGHDHLGVERRPERRLDIQLGRTDDGRDGGFVDADAPNRHRLDDHARVVGQGCDAGEEHLRHPGAARHPAGLVAGGEQLLGDERVAAGTLHELLHDRRLRRSPQDRLGLGGHLFGSKPVELQDLDGRHAGQLGDPWQQRVPPVELVAAIGEHDRPGPAAAAHQIADEVEGRRVRPVEVLDHDHERALSGGPLEERPDGVEHAAGDEGLGHRRRIGHGEPGAQGRRDAHEVGADRVQQRTGAGLVAGPEHGLGRGHDRGEWERRVHEGRTAADNELEPASRRLDAQLQDEPRLPDPRLAADDHRLGVAGGPAIHGGHELVELLGAADDDRARDPAGHGRDHTHAPVRSDAFATAVSIVVTARPSPRGRAAPGAAIRRALPWSAAPARAVSEAPAGGRAAGAPHRRAGHGSGRSRA